MRDFDFELVLADMDEWEAFKADNREALEEHYGSTSNAYQHAIQGGLMLGGGAAPLTLVRFAD